MMKGNSCSGAAAAEPENAIVPIASAPKAAARREFSFNASRLNIGGPLFERPRAPVRRVVDRITSGQRFPVVCVKTPKWFRWGRELFRLGFIQTGACQSYFLDLLFCPRANCCCN